MTDAKLAAGVLDPDYFLGGRLRLHPRLAQDALRRLGDGLDLARGSWRTGSSGS